MTNIPLGQGAYNRIYAEEYQIELLNRFLEVNPTNQVEQIALLARPGNTLFLKTVSGRVRKLAHQPGAFNGDLFYVTGNSLFRYDGTTKTPITGFISLTGTPAITFVGGPGFEHLFIADGQTLQFYDGEAFASGSLTVSGAIVDGDALGMDGVFYAWTTGSVDAGSPAGTSGNPWLVNMSPDDTAALANMVLALNFTGVSGVDYSTALPSAHLTVEGVSSTATLLSIRARTRGTAGNSITTTETGANIAWANPTLSGGGDNALNGVVTPDDAAVVSLTNLASFVLLVLANSQRFYWIQPGSLVIDALDFAEAENEPDEIIEAVRVGDSVYLVGQTSTEVWYATGTIDPNESPFAPQKGLAFSQGVLEGTVVPIRTQVLLVAEDGIAYQIAGGPKRISNNGIEERIRLGQAAQGA